MRRSSPLSGRQDTRSFLQRKRRCHRRALLPASFAVWLTTVVARICLDMLRERKSRSEVRVDAEVESLHAANNPEDERLIADSIGVAMLVVLETLAPASLQ